MDLKTCSLCDLSKSRTQVVKGRGSHTPLVVFVGEAPGKDEDSQGKPFVGEAGQIFEQFVDAIGLSKGEYYVTNVVKCRPTKGEKGTSNRKPTEDEISACKMWLDAELEMLGPRLVVLLGGTAMKARLGFTKVHEKRGVFYSPDEKNLLVYFVTYHPASLIYPGRDDILPKVREDALRLKAYVKKLREAMS